MNIESLIGLFLNGYKKGWILHLICSHCKYQMNHSTGINSSMDYEAENMVCPKCKRRGKDEVPSDRKTD